ncbi:hypothetical protein [Spirochaeta africana]|uniref:Uncharacterized protein n=1 Tax=Spirochaeta africana (strain ATCC 700263 / DSM 8902 / Z-7692) TaxID=889378 RepID=H9UJ77_SPIAZ|nr:hypothetical protein [Spirochaeta africana]AFG37570.1 hypothetical protein Spiaf_1511 [Spirochaeta africana DSM 8902]
MFRIELFPRYVRAAAIAGSILLLAGCGLMTTVPILEPPEFRSSISVPDDLLYYFRHTSQSNPGFQGYNIYYKWYTKTGTVFDQDIQALEDAVISENLLNNRGFFRFRDVSRGGAPTIPITAQSDFSIEDDDGRVILTLYTPDRDNDNDPTINELRRFQETGSAFQLYDDIVFDDDNQILASDYSSAVRSAINNARDSGSIDLRLGIVVTAYGITPDVRSIYSPIVSPQVSAANLYAVDDITIVE